MEDMLKAVTLNGRPLASHRITHTEITQGGELVYDTDAMRTREGK